MTVEERAQQYYRVQISMWPQAMDWRDLHEDTKAFYIDRIQKIENFDLGHRDPDLQQW